MTPWTLHGSTNGVRTGTSVAMNGNGSRLVVGSSPVETTLVVGYVRVYELNPSALGSWLQLGSDIPNTEPTMQCTTVAINTDGTRVAVGRCDREGAYHHNVSPQHGSVTVYELVGCEWVQQGKVLASIQPRSAFGFSLDMDADGHRVAICTPAHDIDKISRTIVYHWISSCRQWVQLGSQIEIPTTDFASYCTVSLSSDGTAIAVGSYDERTHVFQLCEATWSRVGEPIIGSKGDLSGYSVCLNRDGTVLAVGAVGHQNAGQVRVYQHTRGGWEPVGNTIDGPANQHTVFGCSVSLSDDGVRLAVGARDFSDGRGLVRTYEYNQRNWTQCGIEMVGQDPGENFGYAVSLSANGLRVASGGPNTTANKGITRVFDYDQENSLLVRSIQRFSYILALIMCIGLFILVDSLS